MAPPSSTAKGTYSVCLPANLEIDKNDFSRIGDVHPNNRGNGTYIVEFKYWQDASRYLKAARMASTASISTTRHKEQWAPPSLTSPFDSTPTDSLSQSVLPVVEVSELPTHLMSRRMLEAALEQAGLENDVTNIDFVAADKVKITLTNQRAARTCAKHFHGRKWNRTGNVCAKILTGSGSIGKKSEALASSPSASSGFGGYDPVYIHSALLQRPVCSSRKHTVTSDASTAVSDEDEESWEKDIRNVISECSLD